MRRAASGSRMQPLSASESTRHARTHSCLPARTSMFIRFSRSVRYEKIALVSYGSDEPRMLRIRLDLLAQPHDPKIHAAVERIPIPLFVEIQNMFARKSPIRMFGERLEEVELERRHRHFSALLIGQPVRSDIQHAATDAHSCGPDVGPSRGRR